MRDSQTNARLDVELETDRVGGGFWQTAAAARNKSRPFGLQEGQMQDALPAYTLAFRQQVLVELAEAARAAQAARSLLQSSLDAQAAEVAILDEAGQVLVTNRAWNKAACLLGGSPSCDAAKINYIEMCERGQPWQRKIAAGLRKVLLDECVDYCCEYARDNEVHTWHRMRCTRIGTGGQGHLFVAHEDITNARNLENALRQLPARLMQSRDEERRRISRELHDSTAQNLLGATLLIGQALRSAPALPATVSARLEESRALIDQNQCEMRTLCYLLHPPLLDEAGLPASLRLFVAGFAARSAIIATVDIATRVARMPVDIEAALFRVAQEALTNVQRHSNSRTVQVGFREEKGSSGQRYNVLIVEDQGIGMPNGVLGPTTGNTLYPLGTNGIGLACMQERVHQFGGQLEITSSPYGTRILARVPLPAGDDICDEAISSCGRAARHRTMPARRYHPRANSRPRRVLGR